MDHICRLHKWSGILTLGFAAMHWLIEMSDDLLKATNRRADGIRKNDFSAFAEPVQDLGEALGNYTHKLSRQLVVSNPLQVENPYGRFEFNRANHRTRQIWIATSIDVTPFIAWLESLQGEHASEVATDILYCVRDHTVDPFFERLQELCNAKTHRGIGRDIR